eukprot:scaffold419271_cov29-Prasinocladus_malaysianus.AAC.1
MRGLPDDVCHSVDCAVNGNEAATRSVELVCIEQLDVYGERRAGRPGQQGLALAEHHHSQGRV